MRITGVRLRPYRLGLRQPWLNARGRLGVRQGWTVGIEADRRRMGLGDCAPLPAFGTESADDAFAAVQELTADLIGRPPGLMVDALDDRHPAARAAVECALLDLLAQVDGIPLARRLAASTAKAARAAAALGAIDDTLHSRAQAALLAGQRVLTIALGLQSPREELTALDSLASILPASASLRLDAGGAWGEGEAAGLVQALARLPVESLIDPLAEPTLAGLARLQRQAVFPLAVDAARTRMDGTTASDEPPVKRLMLRPTALGGAGPTVALAQRAQRAGFDCVIAGGVDGAVNAWLAVHVAAAIDPDQQQAHDIAHSAWLAQDLGAAPSVRDGRIAVPDGPGLGVPSLGVTADAGA